MAVLAIGVKEKEEKKEREGHKKCLEDSSSTSISGGGNKANRTLEATSLAEAWKLRTSCCNNLAACHFQVIRLKILSVLYLAPFYHFSGAIMPVLFN